MFTGLIEAMAEVVRAERPPGPLAATTAGAGTNAEAEASLIDQPLRLELRNPWAHLVDAPGPKGAPVTGDSVAIDGVCLTVVPPRGGGAEVLAFDVAHATLLRTTLGKLAVGQTVHLERALAFGDRLGGHLVAGHVDARGTVGARRQQGSSLYVGVDVSAEVAALSAAQGSITLAGVSLTIASIEGSRVWVCLIPHTLAVTHLGALQVGDAINCEADLLARYLKRLVQAHPMEPRHAL